MRRIPGKLLPHRNLVKVDTYKGGGAGGRVYDGQTTIKRALIIDDVDLIRDQYDAETTLSAIIYFHRDEVVTRPEPETRIIIWAGTPDERTAYVVKCGRYHHPKITDLLEVRLR